MRLNGIVVATLTASLILALVACESTQTSQEKSEQETLAREKKAAKQESERAALESAAATTIARAKRDQPAIEKHFTSSVGYVVFPTVATGALGIGASNGKGVVYEHRSMLPDRVIGTADVTGVTIGFAIGGQTFSEIIFFQDAGVLENFKKNNVEFNSSATGVAGGEGATAAAKYENGVAIYVFGEKGLMGSASIGGQGFKFKPS